MTGHGGGGGHGRRQKMGASAAALAALEDRRLLAGQLRGLGVTVVDAPPGALAPALADAYLKVKATGRL